MKLARSSRAPRSSRLRLPLSPTHLHAPLFDHAPALCEALAYLFDRFRVWLEPQALRAGLQVLYAACDRLQDHRHDLLCPNAHALLAEDAEALPQAQGV